MATQKMEWVGPAAAAYALSDGPRFGSVNTSGQIERADTQGDDEDGIIIGESSQQGDHVRLALGGSQEITLGATMTPGQYAMTDSQGRAILATSGEQVLGRITKGGAVGETGDILLGVGPDTAV